MDENISSFVKKNGWALNNYTIDTVNPDVVEVFHQARDHFHEEEYFMMGESLAEICWILQDPENNTFEVLEPLVEEIDHEKYKDEY